MTPQIAEPLELFCSYAHEDKELRAELETHLATLKQEDFVRSWYDLLITAGKEWDREIKERLNSADIILLLVSPDFLASDYCRSVEVARAMERHEAGEARVIPVILRPSGWKNTPLRKLNALPQGGEPVTRWPDRDEAFLNVAEGIRATALELIASRAPQPGAPADSPKARPLVNLPRPPAVGFVSRRDEQGRDILERLREELSPERDSLVALWGPGGSGKTTLAAEAVRDLRSLFGNRLAWVSALGRADFSLQTLLDEVATALGSPELRRAKPDDKPGLVRALVSASPALVVLDNFETIKPAEQAACADFLAGCGQCPALITTRAHINRDEVTNIRLAAMEPDEAREFLRRLVERSGKPSAFTGLDADALIADCEGTPLIMQWVVSQLVRARRPQDVLEEIRRGEGDAARRVFTRSFNLLNADARAVLLALPLFTPDASRPALADVAGFGEDLPRLERAGAALSSLWLVETTAGNERLLLRGLTRQLAKSHLAHEARAPEFHQRFIAHFLRYAKAHDQETAEDLDALELEKDNLFGALDVSFEGQDWQSVIGIREALSIFLGVRGYWAEAINTGERAFRAPRSSEEESSVARIAYNLATTYQERGEVAEARRLHGESLEISKRLDDQRGVATSLHQLARLAHTEGETGEARRLYAETLEISKRIGDLRIAAAGLHNLAMLAQDEGEAEEARRLYAESLEINRRLGHQRGIANSLHHLGMLARAEGDLGEARRLYGESLEIKRQFGDQSGIAVTLNNLGGIAAQEGDKEEAARLFREALSIWERLGSPNVGKARRNLERVEG